MHTHIDLLGNPFIHCLTISDLTTCLRRNFLRLRTELITCWIQLLKRKEERAIPYNDESFDGVWPCWPGTPSRSVSGLQLPPHILQPPDPPCRAFCRLVQIGKKLATVGLPSHTHRLLGICSWQFELHKNGTRKGQPHTNA